MYFPMTLLLSVLLNSYPSASTIHYHDNRLYVMGDDATSILIMDTNYQKTDSIALSSSGEKRIPKSVKADIESSIITGTGSRKKMILAGSCSKENRERLIVVTLQEPSTISEYSMHPFVRQLRSNGLTDINLEGMTKVKRKLVFANRAHLGNPVNHLVIVGDSFWRKEGQTIPVHTIRVDLPDSSSVVAGISELYYHAAMDLLVFAMTTEHTTNAFDDGTIGDSYLGFIRDFSTKTSKKALSPDHLQNLSVSLPAIAGQKIEGLTIQESTPEKWILHLAADNDNGSSTFFKVEMDIPFGKLK